MIVITVARKPLSSKGGTVATNVLEHGCGALNINASRIRPAESEGYNTLTVNKGQAPGELNPGCGHSLPQHKENWGDWTSNSTGRWPANLILQHLEGCQMAGTKQVRTGTAHRDNKTIANKVYVGEWNPKGVGGLAGYASPDGTETVAAWDCEPGCPVVALDEQSGKSGAHQTGSGGVARSDYSADRTVFGTYGAAKPFDYGDKGGASRFFKQVRDK